MTSRDLVEKAISLWNNQDREGYLACFAEDCEFIVPGSPGKGRASVAAYWDFNHTAFPDGHIRIEVLAESGETAMIEAVFEATHSGTLGAVGTRREIPASGKRFLLHHVNIYVVRDGLIVEHRCYWDRIEALDQLG